MFWPYHQTVKRNLPNKWFCGVDSIRFILAFVVLLSHSNMVYVIALKHSNVLFFKLSGRFWANAFDGTSAVIAFFIISGFVIHYPNKKGISSLTQFWVRRFTRIVIPLLVAVAIGSFFNHPERTVLWSLYCEIIYYALYPLLLNIKLTWKSKLIASYTVLVVIILSIHYHIPDSLFRYIYHHYHFLFVPLQMFLMAIELLPCWLLGVILAEKIDYSNVISFKSVTIYRLLAFIGSWFCSVGKFHFHVWYMISMSVFALLLFKWIEAEIIYFKSKSPNPVLEKMGKFSYSIYLCHHTIFIALGLLIPVTYYTYPLFLIVTLAISYLFYLIIEKPSHLLALKVNTKLNSSLL